MSIFRLKTKRLKLLPLRLDQLQAVHTGAKPLAAAIGITLREDLFNPPVRKALEIKIFRMRREAPYLHPWLTYWLMVLRDEEVGIGLLGFKGAPVGAGQVEVGYGISKLDEGQGYTSEAVKALLSWAFDQPKCRVIVAETRKDNPASMRVLEKVGMERYAETEGFYAWRLAREK